jgi:hypothetical protein
LSKRARFQWTRILPGSPPRELKVKIASCRNFLPRKANGNRARIRCTYQGKEGNSPQLKAPETRDYVGTKSKKNPTGITGGIVEMTTTNL